MRVQIPPGPPNIHATVAELADALCSERSGLTTRGGSTPLGRTKSSRKSGTDYHAALIRHAIAGSTSVSATKPRYLKGRVPVLHTGNGGSSPSRGTIIQAHVAELVYAPG